MSGPIVRICLKDMWWWVEVFDFLRQVHKSSNLKPHPHPRRVMQVKIMEESIEILKTTVAELRTIISRQVGLPVGAFRLTTEDDRELYDQHTLWSYDLEIGL